MLFASDISKSYSDRTLFSGLSLSLAAGDRVALIGLNGSGKTTLMDILAGETSPETGSISRRRNVTVGYLKQEPASFADRPLLEEVLDAGSEVNALADEMSATQEALSSETDPARQGDLLERLSQLDMALEAAGGEDRDHEAKAILSGLGFKQSDFLRPMGEFSGGWAMRAGLARLLFRKPDLLLLDEPTNHLDLDANLWFEKYLASFKGGVLITSHDRAFLNQVATRVLAIETDEVVLLRGNYDHYLVARERSLEIKRAAKARQEREVQRQMRFVERFRSKARKATQVQSRLKQLEKMQTIELPRATRKVHYSFPAAPRGGSEVIRLANVSKSYGDNVVYRGMNLTLSRGDRVALVGPNGAGKTTMLKLLAGVIPVDDGERKTGHNVVTAYYAQHVLELLNPGNTLIEELRQAAPGESEQNLRNTLGGFLFHGDDVRKPISVLSGGEKARVAWPSCFYNLATCSSWTSRPTTSTSPPGRYWRTLSATIAAASASLPTTGLLYGRSPTRLSRLMAAGQRSFLVTTTAICTGSRSRTARKTPVHQPTELPPVRQAKSRPGTVQDDHSTPKRGIKDGSAMSLAGWQSGYRK